MPVLYHGDHPSRLDPRLLDATHVFLRVDAVRRPLVPPYEGPFPVVSRSPSTKTFVILKRGKPITVTVDRLKPAVLLPDVSAAAPPALPAAKLPLPAAARSWASVAASPPSPGGLRPRPRVDRPSSRPAIPANPAPTTSSGRISRPVHRFQA